MSKVAILKCICLDKSTGIETLVPELGLRLFSKDVFQYQNILGDLHQRHQAADKNYRYYCSCGNEPILYVTSVANKQRFVLRDQHINQHSEHCSLNILVQQKDKNGKKIGLTKKMLIMPTKKELKTAIGADTQVPKAYRKDANQNRYSTFNGLMATTIDLTCCISNSRFPEVKQDSFLKVFQGQILNMKFEQDSSFAEHRKRLEEKGEKLFFKNAIVNDIKITAQKDGIIFSPTNLSETTLANLAQSLEMSYKINDGEIEYLRGDILLNALQTLKNHGNFTQGPYLITAITTAKTSKMYGKVKTRYQTPLLNICPILISQKHILPVESNLERNCFQALFDQIPCKAYKPLTLDKEIYWNQLLSFFIDHKVEQREIQRIYHKCAHVGQPIRPDLFYIHNDKMFVVEITGMMNKPAYALRIFEKEEKFYSHLSQIIYLRASSPEEFIDVINKTKIDE